MHSECKTCEVIKNQPRIVHTHIYIYRQLDPTILKHIAITILLYSVSTAARPVCSSWFIRSKVMCVDVQTTIELCFTTSRLRWCPERLRWRKNGDSLLGDSMSDEHCLTRSTPLHRKPKKSLPRILAFFLRPRAMSIPHGIHKAHWTYSGQSNGLQKHLNHFTAQHRTTAYLVLSGYRLGFLRE